MSMLPPKLPSPAKDREVWPEIDRLTAVTSIDVRPCATWYAAVKVGFDYVVALLALPFALVLIAFAALATKLTSPGPVFYTQTRLGLNGRKYKIIKIRSMHHNCEAKTGVQWSQKGDSRVTRLGQILRVTHIDELPQLWNVLRGERSLVGPRPERPEVIAAKGLEQLVPGYRHRLLVKPGVTGLAQVQLPADSDITGVRYKVVYDLYYVQNQSLLLDLRLIAATVLKAAGIGPRWIRRVFFLPNRTRVAEVFRENLGGGSGELPQLQPA
ncbi:MAG TPA: sugar transferase [Gemmataceae bacterium]|nr:sugar transferase [Gemmataceae bacterium]